MVNSSKIVAAAALGEPGGNICRKRPPHTLGPFIEVRDHFKMALCVHQIRNGSNKKFYSIVLSTKNATDPGKFRGFISLNSLCFILCSLMLVPH